MLYEFLIKNRTELVARTQSEVERRQAPRATAEELKAGIPLFLDQLIETLKDKSTTPQRLTVPMGPAAARHGQDLLARGFTVAQVVHDYGSLCQAVTGLAVDLKSKIAAEEFQTLNRCLDDAIADAVTEYGRQRDKAVSDKEAERLGSLAHEMRNLLSAATLSYEAVLRGSVTIGGSTGSILGRSLKSLRDLVDRSLAEVRLAAGLAIREPILLAELIEEVEVAAAMDARVRGLELTVTPAEYGVVITGDRQLLAAALANLLHNAFKFSRPAGHVSLKTRVQEGQVLIEVEDECGGLPPGKAEELFLPFHQPSADKSGLGLGLTISQRSVKASGGNITVRNIPGKGCVFTVCLPLPPQAPHSPRVIGKA